jgi:CHAT domain-containing protein
MCALDLNVCNGGLYRFGPGDEPYGMVPAALIAGAENVLGTLWAIDDRIGRSFMTRLYKELLEAGPAAALQAPAAEFREDGAHIREWAGFVNVGAGRPLAAK